MPPKHPRQLSIEDFSYTLPEDRIATHPLPQREASKLLCWEKGILTDRHFTDLPQVLPKNSLLVLNQSRVIPARLHFTKETGGAIEVFCLEPDERYGSIEAALAQRSEVYWRCMVGGAAKWKAQQMLRRQAPDGFELTAEAHERTGGNFTIHFRWSDRDLCFGEVLEKLGAIPLPPYMNRAPEADDCARYQTVFARSSGSVAAPTASLHFSENLLEQLAEGGTQFAYSTLHVGAGTFAPVKAETMAGHDMHSEWIEADRTLVESLQKNLDGNIVAVGTTALRTIESLYWIGCKLAQKLPVNWEGNAVSQWEPYEHFYREVPVEEALEALRRCLDNMDTPLRTRTQILLAPGYNFRLARGLITNFHQPHSTLLLLVAACVGEDWKRIYEHALTYDYRFLSYGDGSYLEMR